MKCPVCKTEYNENIEFCHKCSWEFPMYITDVSEAEKEKYKLKLEIAQKNWQEKIMLKKKLNALKNNGNIILKKASISKNQNMNQHKIENNSQIPDIQLDMFERESEYNKRMNEYGMISAGTASLQRYDIKTQKFFLKIKKDKWIDDNFKFDSNESFIIAERKFAKDLYEKQKDYPVKLTLYAFDRKVYIRNAFLISDQAQIEIQNIQKDEIPVQKNIVEPFTNMEFIYVSGGSFQMGDVFGDGYSNEKPVHHVSVNDFYIGKYPVTQGQWEIVMKNNPSKFKKGKDYPVENVSWNDAQEFIKKLKNNNNGKFDFRLPSEIEWEYAARSGGKKEKYAGSANIEDVAWYSENSGKSTHPVGQKMPNGLDLYDMSGNVWEWCNDFYYEDIYKKRASNISISNDIDTGLRVLRGGSWNNDAGDCRVFFRGGYEPGNRSSSCGFRLVFSPRSVS